MDIKVSDSLQFLSEVKAPSNSAQNNIPLYGIITTQTPYAKLCVLESTQGLANLRVNKKAELVLLSRVIFWYPPKIKGHNIIETFCSLLRILIIAQCAMELLMLRLKLSIEMSHSKLYLFKPVTKEMAHTLSVFCQMLLVLCSLLFMSTENRLRWNCRLKILEVWNVI